MEENILRGKKILIVEDDFSSKLYLNKILEKSGAELFNAGDGQEALDRLAGNPGIDLILMDIQLPVMDGYTCTKLIRKSGNEVVIIAQTAYGMSADKDMMKSLGFNDYLIKPITQKQLIDKVTEYLL